VVAVGIAVGVGGGEVVLVLIDSVVVRVEGQGVLLQVFLVGGLVVRVA